MNTGILTLEHVVRLISQALEYKANLLSTATEELGPGAGLARYAGQPGDFRPPENMAE